MTATDFRAGGLGEGAARPDAAARRLVEAVRRGDRITTQRILTCPDLPRIAALLAHWHTTGLPPKPLQPCGTRSAAERHLSRGELLDDACLAARRAYFREREHLRRRTRRSGVDEVAIQRACDGQPVALSRVERLEAVRRLHGRGMSHRDVAERVGVSERQVQRDVVELSQTTANERTGAA